MVYWQPGCIVISLRFPTFIVVFKASFVPNLGCSALDFRGSVFPPGKKGCLRRSGVLDCASLLALSSRKMQTQSGRRLPHSKTWHNWDGL